MSPLPSLPLPVHTHSDSSNPLSCLLLFAEPREPLRQLADRLVPENKRERDKLYQKIVLLTISMKHRDILRNMLQGTDDEIMADISALNTDCEWSFVPVGFLNA